MAMEQVVSYPLSIAVIEAIATAEGVDPTDLGYSLYEYVDLDAIDALYENSDTDWRLQFQVAEHTVTVDSDGAITVDGTFYEGSATHD